MTLKAGSCSGALGSLSDFLLLIVILILISEEAEGTEVAAHGTEEEDGDSR